MGTTPLSAQITPYDPDESGLPRAYIWPSKAGESRIAMPRGPVTVDGAPTPDGTAGVKHLRHSLDVFLNAFGGDYDPDSDTSFPAVIDVVMWALRTAPNPAQVTDPVTGFASQLVDIGENMELDYPPVYSVEDQRFLGYVACITVPVLEQFSA